MFVILCRKWKKGMNQAGGAWIIPFFLTNPDERDKCLSQIIFLQKKTRK
jgi:hypothetical protein